MKRVGILIILILFIIFLTPVAYADHSTCTGEYQPYYGANTDDPCDTPIDWDSMFDNIELSDGSTVGDIENRKYRLLYHEGLTMLNSPQELRDSIYLYESYTTTGFNSEYEITGDSDSRTIDFSKNGAFSSSSSDEEFVPDTLRTEIKIPENTSVEFRINDKDGELVDTRIMYPDTTEQMRTKSIPVDIFEGLESEEYDVTVELNRDNSDVKSPVISDVVVMYESVPEYRSTSESFQKYPYFLNDYHNTMYSNYDLDTIHQLENTKDHVHSPRYEEEKYESFAIESNLFDSSIIDWITDDNKNAIPIRHSYVDINNIEPSVKIPEDDIGTDWDTIIGDEGTIYVAYDAAIDDIPEDDDDISGLGPSKGDEVWTYEKDKIEFEFELFYESDGEVYEIDSYTETSNSGIQKIEYDRDNIVHDDISKFIVEKEMTAIYEKIISVYEENDDEDDDGLELNFDRTEEESFGPYNNTDTKEIYGFASDDGPEENDDNFDIQIANYPDDTRIFVDIDQESNTELSPETNINLNRWTNMLFSGVTMSGDIHVERNRQYNEQINIGRKSTIDEYRSFNSENKNQRIIDNQITEDMDVYLSVWTSGNFGENPDIDIQIEGNDIDTDDFESNEHRDELNTIIEYENISDYVYDKEDNIHFHADINNVPDDVSTQPRIDYMVTIDVDDKPFSKVSSKWNYWFFRDSRWDGIEEINENCGDTIDDLIGDCFDYQGESPESTGIHPIQAHILPSSYELDNSIYTLTNDINIIDYAETEQTLHLPVNSNNCSYHPDYGDDERICDVHNNYIVNDINMEEDEEEINTNTDDETTQERINRFLGIYNLDMFDSLYEDEQRQFKEPSKFEIISDEPVHNVSISGNATWSHSDFDIDNVRNVQSTNLNVDVVPMNDLTEEFVNSEKQNIRENNQLKPYYMLDLNEVQLRLELKDENLQPIDTYSRNTSEMIYVQNGDITNENEITDSIDNNRFIDTTIDTYKFIDTNEDGVAYITVHNNFFDDDVSNLDISFVTQDWWTVPEDTRLLSSSSEQYSQNYNPYPEQESEIPDAASYYDIITSIIFIFAFMFFITATMFRIHPKSTMTTMDLFYIVTEPFREPIKESLQYVILALLFSFILLMFIAI